jgi:hypothetical protein
VDIVGRETSAGGPGEGLGRGSWARRLRVGAGIVLVLVFALRTPCQEALLVPFGSFDKDPVSLAERRFLRLAETLPPRGVFGYRASGQLKLGRNHELEGDDRSIAGYVLAQYFLAPRVLDLGPTRPLVIRDDLDPIRVMPREDR